MPVSFFDHQSGLSALAIQHVSTEGRMVIVYHDAPSPAAARAALSRVAETLAGELAPGQVLGLIECCVPEHAAEPFIYARATLSSVRGSGRVDVGAARVVSVEAVARACGIEVREVERTEHLVASVHRPRRCAFPGFRQLRLGDRGRRGVAAA
jgi:hypothetical protein